MQVIFTLIAQSQIDDLHREITLRSGFETRADAYIERIINYCLSLATFPHRGRLRDDLMPGLRTSGFERRVTIAYITTDEAIHIAGIYYGGQDFESDF